MKLTVQRFSFQEKCTIGKLLIDGRDVKIFTLEGKYREEPGVKVSEWKVPRETAIPKGTYKVIVDFSQHFQRELPLLLNVPDYVGVRIHTGNIDSDTEGCVLIGKTWLGGDYIGQSREAFNEIFPLLKSADTIEIEIV